MAEKTENGSKGRKKGTESIDLFPLQIQLQILPTEGSETELDPYSITVFKRHSLPCPCVQSFIINNKPETKDLQTHSHAQSSRQRKVMAKQLLHMDIQYLLRIRRVVLWRPAVTLFEINARKYTLHLYIQHLQERERERESENEIANAKEKDKVFMINKYFSHFLRQASNEMGHE